MIKGEFQNKIEMKRLYSWGAVDSLIEDELQRPSFQAQEEIDGTLVEYSIKFKQMTYLIFFGAAWPLAFLIAWLTNIFDRFWLMKRMASLLRRPTPKGGQDIGSWSLILSYLSVLGIFFNAGLAAFTIHVIEPDCTEQKDFLCDPFHVRMITVYAFLAVGFFFRIIAAAVINPEPEWFRSLILRQQHRSAVINMSDRLPQVARSGLSINLPRQVVEYDLLKKNLEKVEAEKRANKKNTRDVHLMKTGLGSVMMMASKWPGQTLMPNKPLVSRLEVSGIQGDAAIKPETYENEDDYDVGLGNNKEESILLEDDQGEGVFFASDRLLGGEEGEM